MNEIINKFDFEKHVDNTKFKRAFLILIIGIIFSIYFIPVLVIPIILLFFYLIFKSIDLPKLLNQK